MLQDALSNALTELLAAAGFRNPNIGLPFEVLAVGGQIGGFTLHTGVFVKVKASSKKEECREGHEEEHIRSAQRKRPLCQRGPPAESWQRVRQACWRRVPRFSVVSAIPLESKYCTQSDWHWLIYRGVTFKSGYFAAV